MGQWRSNTIKHIMTGERSGLVQADLALLALLLGQLHTLICLSTTPPQKERLATRSRRAVHGSESLKLGTYFPNRLRSMEQSAEIGHDGWLHDGPWNGIDNGTVAPPFPPWVGTRRQSDPSKAATRARSSPPGDGQNRLLISHRVN